MNKNQSLKAIRAGTYTAIRGDVSRYWEEIEIPETGFRFWKWQEDFGDREGLAMECEDEKAMDDDEWFLPDDQTRNDQRITSEVITSLLENRKYTLR